MTIPMEILEIKKHQGDDYSPVIDFETWRVAILNFSPQYLPENITTISRHKETDEVFVLLDGHCILFVGEEKNDKLDKIYVQNMKPFTAYNVRKGVWHTHSLDSNAKVLIVENLNTCSANSETIEMTDVDMDFVKREAAKLLENLTL